MDYRIRCAHMDDLPRIQEIYSSARAYMASHGNPNQWGTSRPEISKLINDISREELFVLIYDGVIHGVFALILGADPTYGEISQGQWHSDRSYGTLHRVAGDGSGGILRAAVAFAEKRADYLRIDTHENNLAMRKAILREGFVYCGVIFTDNGTPRLAFDRLV